MFERHAWHQYLQWLQQKELALLPPYDPVHASLGDAENTLDYVQLKREAARLISINPDTAWKQTPDISKSDKAEVVDYLRRIRDLVQEKVDMATSNAVVVKGCRFENMLNRKDSQVLLANRKEDADCLHMTKLFDYYESPVLICQAPMKKQFEAHWEAIWQELVGTVVWIGEVVERGERKIDEYIGMRVDQKVSCGVFRIRTTMAASIQTGYEAYRVILAKGTQSRELIFIHIRLWPDHGVPHEPAILADLVWQIQGHQLRQTEKGLPCLLVHCSLGVQRSPAFLAAYIGRQMWLANKKVNVLGILRYIRRHRWKAFGMGNPFAQVQIVFGVLEVIAMRSQLEGLAPLQADADEQKAFDRSARRAEVDKAKTKSLTMRLNEDV